MCVVLYTILLSDNHENENVCDIVGNKQTKQTKMMKGFCEAITTPGKYLYLFFFFSSQAEGSGQASTEQQDGHEGSSSTQVTEGTAASERKQVLSDSIRLRIALF